MLSALKKKLQQERRASVLRGPGAAAAVAAPVAVSHRVAVEAEFIETPLPPLAQVDADKLEAVRVSHPRLYDSLCALDSVQLSTMLNDEPSLLVRAPIGSGKTTVLVHKVLYLHFVRGVPLRELAVLTFTNRAAAEIRARITALSAQTLHDDDFWLTGTFHGVARALLSRVLPIAQLGYRPDFTMLDEEQQEAIFDELIRSKKLRVGRRSTLRQRLRQAGETKTGSGGDLARLAQLFAEEKQRRNAMDFDDLIDHATTLLPDPQRADSAAKATEAAGASPLGTLTPPRWLIVDELQDCEPRELALLSRLRAAGTGFFAVGDPYQAIYGWRGSDPALFAQAETTFQCGAAVLPRNYRSTRTIVDSARAVLGFQPGRPSGTLSAARSFGDRLVVRRHHDPVSEALYLAERITRLHDAGIPYGEVAILFRLRAQAEPLRAALTARNIPCREPTEAAGDAVQLLTLHAAKGLEFRQVFLSGINEGLVPLGHRFDLCGDSEERRLLFVGLTRARDRVEISYHARPHEFAASGEPSRYLAFIPRALVAWENESTADTAPALAAVHDVPVKPTDAPLAAELVGCDVSRPAGAELVGCDVSSAELPGNAIPRSAATELVGCDVSRPAGAELVGCANPPGPLAAAVPAAGDPWVPEQAVRHPRYGVGVVLRVSDGTVHCSFGKFGERAFPLALCPLQPIARASE